MAENHRLPRSFYNRSTLQVARDLLGARLIRVEHGARIGGVIIEAEAAGFMHSQNRVRQGNQEISVA